MGNFSRNFDTQHILYILYFTLNNCTDGPSGNMEGTACFICGSILDMLTLLVCWKWGLVSITALSDMFSLLVLIMDSFK